MLRLRPFRSEDAKVIINWCQDETAFYKWTAGIMGPYPLTEEHLLEVTSGRMFNDKYFPFVAFDETGVVGFFTFRALGDSLEEMRYGYVIVDPKIRGKGYGKKMLELGKSFAFDVYGASKVTLGVFDNNPSAHYCYLAAGLKDTGVTESYALNGEEWTCIEMELVK